MQQMRYVKLDDERAHTRLIIALQVSGAMERYLKNTIADGVMASQQINLRGKRID
jgi:hypothetical protein